MLLHLSDFYFKKEFGTFFGTLINKNNEKVILDKGMLYFILKFYNCSKILYLKQK